MTHENMCLVISQESNVLVNKCPTRRKTITFSDGNGHDLDISPITSPGEPRAAGSGTGAGGAGVAAGGGDETARECGWAEGPLLRQTTGLT